MDSIERGDFIEDKCKPRSWWKRLNWNRIIFFFGVVLFLYDFSYCVIMFFYIKALNTNPDFRLQAFKTNNRFMKLYYTLHHYLGDPTLEDTDINKWHEEGEL